MWSELGLPRMGAFCDACSAVVRHATSATRFNFDINRRSIEDSAMNGAGYIASAPNILLLADCGLPCQLKIISVCQLFW